MIVEYRVALLFVLDELMGLHKGVKNKMQKEAYLCLSCLIGEESQGGKSKAEIAAVVSVVCVTSKLYKAGRSSFHFLQRVYVFKSRLPATSFGAVHAVKQGKEWFLGVCLGRGFVTCQQNNIMGFIPNLFAIGMLLAF